jgi:GLPGLI family protein
MKVLQLLFTLTLLAPLAQAQVIDTVQLRVHYKTAQKHWVEDKGRGGDETILEIGKTRRSRFCSLAESKLEEALETVSKRGGTFEEIQVAQAETGYKHSYNWIEVYKNYPKEGKLTYTDRLFIPYRYEEEMEMPQWTIHADGQRAIAGYLCQKATTTFRGREWTAWFTIDIPIQEGPWKLYGLPGLILHAEDSQRDFRFACIYIEQPQGESVVFPQRKYTKCTLKQLQKVQLLCWEDPAKYFRSIGQEYSEGHYLDGRPVIYKPRTPAFLEYPVNTPDNKEAEN